ncbi:MAG: rod shape-determining protein RodA [Bacteroidota bacterium]|nr:rod shape-determining protein RodA [Bacteroidota bacterium]
MRESKGVLINIDWITVLVYFLLILMGWINIYAAVYNEEHQNIFDITQRYGKQLIWISAAVFMIFIILLIDAKFFSTFAFAIYGISIFLLIAVLLFGKEIAGSRSWFQIGSFGIQPAEFAKVATALALSKYLSTFNITIKRFKSLFFSLLIILAPAALILLQNDTGSALIFIAFIIVLYREGLPGIILLLGVVLITLFLVTLLLEDQFYFLIAALLLISGALFFFIKRSGINIIKVALLFIVLSGFVASVNYTFEKVLSEHHKTRINVLIGKEADLKGAGYNVHQSKIAIGSGGFSGKGFLKGTQTKYNFVPEQDTDFIFCTVGEEWGFLGSFSVIALFLLLFTRLIRMAERQKSDFARIYGYCVVSILFLHFVVNIGMTIGLVPVIGIPLPFFSYGGSSLWSFSILLFIFIRQDAYRWQVL